ncbi:MAG: hypothetical protein IIW68_06155, partial [Lachnospiraceae bacterium]|nr:hypothetical protein [Lachnospiraceae bacterium]
MCQPSALRNLHIRKGCFERRVFRLNALGIPCFGPDAKAARIEASKVFSKDLMKKYGIPTAGYEVFTDCDEALKWLDTQEAPL